MRFSSETGIGRHEWLGRYWARWGDVLAEAGFEPNEKTAPADRDAVLTAYLGWITELGRIPTEGELRVRNHADKGFPGREAIRSALGGKAERLRLLLDFAQASSSPQNVVEILRREISKMPESVTDSTATHSADVSDGFVYLMKSGKNYKIGRTNALDRRQYEIGMQLPERLDPIHSIRTDDPAGIETYWHTRFGEKRLNGEWFRLSNDDVRTFKRRKFM